MFLDVCVLGFWRNAVLTSTVEIVQQRYADVDSSSLIVPLSTPPATLPSRSFRKPPDLPSTSVAVSWVLPAAMVEFPLVSY